MKHFWIKKIILVNLILSLSLLLVVCVENCLEISAENHLTVSETQSVAAQETCGQCFVESHPVLSAPLKEKVDFAKTETAYFLNSQPKRLISKQLNFPPKRAILPHLLPPLKVLHQLRI